MDDGTELIAVPDDMTIFNGQPAKGSYIVLIKKEGKEFREFIAYNEKPDYFKNLSDVEIQKIYDQAISTSRKQRQRPPRLG